MTRRWFAFPAALIAIVTFITLTAPPVATQSHRVPALVITAYNGAAHTNYVTPKTASCRAPASSPSATG